MNGLAWCWLAPADRGSDNKHAVGGRRYIYTELNKFPAVGKVAGINLENCMKPTYDNE
jgi:hypothetical protein